MNNNSHIHLNSVIICEQKLKWKLSLSDQSGSLTCEHWLFTVCRLQRRSLRQCGHGLCWPHGVQCCYRHLQCVSLHIWLTPFSSLQSCSSWQTANLQPNPHQHILTVSCSRGSGKVITDSDWLKPGLDWCENVTASDLSCVQVRVSINSFTIVFLLL